ncbi:hypothetical protein L2E82_06045 [Cichorium intybus]|uniref:Uncharacterized protein n=1 Tax=Cichorium intybus TaxID=13427 RepID=A0ACB9H8F8_CICIN|nr:hypothetical protein L2E82_06045 [Cichorium intybus]
MSRDDSSYGFSSYDPLQLMKKHPGQDRIKHHNLDQNQCHNVAPTTTNTENISVLNNRVQTRSSNHLSSQKVVILQTLLKALNQIQLLFKPKTLITNNFSTNISRNPTPMEVDTELLDSASSCSSSTTKLTKWEPDYVTKVLEDIETMFTDFTIGKARKIVNPRVFDRLEFGTKVDDGKVVKFRRELVFNCVSECMETKCRVWGKGLAMVTRPDRLAQEVYKEIEGWEDMKDSMVDELVDKDMSGEGCKRWLDFDVEAFEYGVELESWLIDSLINEVVDDMLVL